MRHRVVQSVHAAIILYQNAPPVREDVTSLRQLENEQLAVIKFLTFEGTTPPETHRRLVNVFGKDTLPMRRVHKAATRFRMMKLSQNRPPTVSHTNRAKMLFVRNFADANIFHRCVSVSFMGTKRPKCCLRHLTAVLGRMRLYYHCTCSEERFDQRNAIKMLMRSPVLDWVTLQTTQTVRMCQAEAIERQ
jgi:hypothetical protein